MSGSDDARTGRLRRIRDVVDRALDLRLPSPEGPAARLHAAMRYAVLGGGKRLRPALCLAACEACGADPDRVVGPAAAIEMIHTYSLVHDDLPAMDDDPLRRGRPTVHVAFGEAEAILAGDALLTLAFEVLAREPEDPRFAERRAEAVAVVAAAAGAAGMVGGQMAYLDSDRSDVEPAPLDWIHAHKTGALLAASVEVGAIHAGAGEKARAALVDFGRNLGMAFQIVDDILDVTATAEELGKTPGKDARSGKGSYAARFGVDGARNEAERFRDRAIEALAALPGDTSFLESLARYALGRKG
jgi:geranylgeranyl pyrophosphate synthase